MMNSVQPGDVVTVTVSAGGVTSGNLIAPATSPVLYPIGTAIKGTGTWCGLTAARLWRPAHRRCHGSRPGHVQGDRPHPGAARGPEGRRRRGARGDQPGWSDSPSIEEWRRGIPRG